MLVEDTTAFVEQLEVSAEMPGHRKLQRRILEAELNVQRARAEVDVASSALEQVELALAGGRKRRLLRDRRIIQGQLDRRREELAVCQQKLDQLLAEAESERVRAAATFRLHSSGHTRALSERSFARLSRTQLTRPVLMAKTSGLRWWWYLDRFWWGDDEVSARDLQSLVLGSGLPKLPSDPRAEVTLSDSTRIAVWARDQGRCVDCGTGEGLHFDAIIESAGPSIDSPRNIELRCQGCRERRDFNEARTRVANARADAFPYREHLSLRSG